MESKYSQINEKFEFKKEQKFEELKEILISQIKSIDENGGENYYNIFIKLFNDNPKPEFTEEDLRSPQFCTRNRNKFVMDILDELIDIPDLSNITGKYYVGESKLEENDDILKKTCYYLNYKIEWILAENYVQMKNDEINITWDRTIYPEKKSFIDSKITFLYKDDENVLQFNLFLNNHIFIVYNYNDYSLGESYKKKFEIRPGGKLSNYYLADEDGIKRVLYNNQGEIKKVIKL